MKNITYLPPQVYHYLMYSVLYYTLYVRIIESSSVVARFSVGDLFIFSVPFPLSLCMDYRVRRTFFLSGWCVFLPCDHGLDF